MSQLNWWKTAGAVCVLCAATAIALRAQTFTTLYNFDGTDGSYPSGLVQATNGNFYGTTANGGAHGGGTIFEITPGGTLTTLHSFCSQSRCIDGESPSAALVQATDGDLYGTSYGGGIKAGGTVFKSTLSGAWTGLYTFCLEDDCTDGRLPMGPLVQAMDGNLYGTTQYGGANGYGTIFSITPSGTLATLYSFCHQRGCVGGEYPVAALVQGTDGNFYGTTPYGGANGGHGPCAFGCGTVFKITPGGMLTTLYSFCSQSNCTDGARPEAGLIQATDGNFYGTTYSGGANCTDDAGCGTVFRITRSGTLTTLYSFCHQNNCPDGDEPYAGLVQATDGNFYGTTEIGGANDYGTIFELTLEGTLTTLHSFDDTDGAGLYAGLIQDTNGTFYGTTVDGGAYAYGYGTVFSLSVGLAPFVETQPTSGKVGKAVKILGTNLTGAASVTFNGTAATFTVTSSSLITTTVPAGATTGTVQVATPAGTLSSNVPFRVRP